LCRSPEKVEVRLRLAQSDSASVALDPLRLCTEQAEVLREEQSALQDLAAAEQASQRLELLLHQAAMCGRSLGDGAERWPHDPWDLAVCPQVPHGREQERAAPARVVDDGSALIPANIPGPGALPPGRGGGGGPPRRSGRTAGACVGCASGPA
jgi:hypothetical protein